MTSPNYPSRAMFLRLAFALALVCGLSFAGWRASASEVADASLFTRLQSWSAKHLGGKRPARAAAPVAATLFVGPTGVTGSTGSVTPTAVANTQPTVTLRWLIAANTCCGSSIIYPTHGGDDAFGSTNQTPVVGEIRLVAYDFGSNNLPAGWLECNGQLLQITQNIQLFSEIGTTYGGNGTTNFNVPDLRGRVPVGIGQGPGMANVTLGQKIGGEVLM